MSTVDVVENGLADQVGADGMALKACIIKQLSLLSAIVAL